MNNFQIQPQFQQPIPPVRSFGPPVQPYLPPQNHKKRNLIILFCVLAAVVIFAGVSWFFHINSASYRIGRGFKRLVKEAEALKNPMNEKLGTKELCRMFYTEGSQVDTELDVSFDSFAGEVTLGVDADYAMDRKKKEMSLSTYFSFMRYELGHLDVYADKDNVCFSVPELFLEDLYVENENVLAQYNRSMWADDWFFGEAEGDDFSIDLFSAPWYFESEESMGKAFLTRYTEELESCRRHMVMERAGDGLYRITVEGLYFNNLVRQMLNDYLDDDTYASEMEREGILGLVSYFDVASGPEEISLLLKIGKGDRIESIRLENPLSLGKGAVRIDGDIYFLGTENSLEKMQGRIFFDNKDAKDFREQEILWQVVRTLEQGEYQLESEAKYSFLLDGQKETVKLEGDFTYDGPKNSFEARAAAKIWGENVLEVEASGDFSHIKKGESFDLKLDEVNVLSEGERALLLRGEINVAPLSRRVEEIAKPKTAVFSMGEADWIEIFEKVDREYGYLWETIMDYLW